MEYVYSAMLLHSAKKEIKEDSVKKVLEAAGIHADDGRVKGLVASLKEVNIDEAIEKAATVQAAAPVAGHAEAKKEAKPAQEEKKTEEEAAAGLSSLFG